MNLTSEILQVTGIHPDTYDFLVFKKIFDCLSRTSLSAQHLQLLLQSKSIISWYKVQLKKINIEFIEHIKPFSKLDSEIIKSNYLIHLDRLSNNYPSALINRVKVKNKVYEILKSN